MTDSNPGNFAIIMPDIGEGIAEVEIVEWHVAIGDTIEEDDIIASVMTDKATVEIPSPVDGEVIWQAVNVGEQIAVGAPFVRLQVDGQGNETDDLPKATAIPDPTADLEEKVPPKTSSEPEAVIEKLPKSKVSPTPKTTAKPTMVTGAPRAEGIKPIASPAVRQRARNAGINLHYVRGTGPVDRITHEDLDGFIAGQATNIMQMAASGPMPDETVQEIKVIGLRRKIAAIMQDTMQRIPHFTYVEEIDVTELEKLRTKLNKKRREDQPKLTMLPFFIQALVKAINAYPEMSSHFDDDANIVYQFGAAHIGIATQTDNGLVVPVVRHAETLDIWQSAGEIKRLSSAARDGQATAEELSGSTITITSLGPMGGIVTTPVINSPEVAILGVNKVAKRPVWQDGNFVPRDIMNLSSSFDHRIIDGWEATLFIQHIKGLLESPASLFMPD